MTKPIRKYVLIAISLLTVVFFVFYRSPQEALTVSNVIAPSAAEPIMDFSCSNSSCVVNGQKTNSSGVPLATKIYNLSITNNQINGFTTAGFAVNKGDILVFNFVNRDRQAYYFFIPRLNLAHENSADFSFPWTIRTAELAAGDYPIMLQDSLDPGTVVPNFQAAVIMVQ